jgi:hypothetical protein
MPATFLLTMVEWSTSNSALNRAPFSSTGRKSGRLAFSFSAAKSSPEALNRACAWSSWIQPAIGACSWVGSLRTMSNCSLALEFLTVAQP